MQIKSEKQIISTPMPHSFQMNANLPLNFLYRVASTSLDFIKDHYSITITEAFDMLRNHAGSSRSIQSKITSMLLLCCYDEVHSVWSSTAIIRFCRLYNLRYEYDNCRITRIARPSSAKDTWGVAWEKGEMLKTADSAHPKPSNSFHQVRSTKVQFILSIVPQHPCSETYFANGCLVGYHGLKCCAMFCGTLLRPLLCGTETLGQQACNSL